MKRFIFLAALLSLALYAASCRDKHPPEPEKQYSTWIVNGTDTFRSNNVDAQIAFNPDHSYGGAVIMSHDPENWFSLGFNTDHFPAGGFFLLYIPSDSGFIAAIDLYYNNQYYHSVPYAVDTLFASLHHNKVSYSLPPCWFVKHGDGNDSILVEGVFNEP